MKVIFVLLILSLLLSGCSQAGRWNKEGWTSEQFEKDRNECLHFTERSGSKNAINVSHSNSFERCMRARGYVLEK